MHVSLAPQLPWLSGCYVESNSFVVGGKEGG